jgi:hypothetical protein
MGAGGLGAAETVLREGLLRLGGELLGDLLSGDPGHRGPRVPCGNGHQAEFTDYRGKTFDTVLGPVTLRRAWYHCAACRHGLAPRDAGPGITGTSLSPGLAAMTGTAAAAGPFAKAALLLAELAGVILDVKRVERAAEASGAAQSAAVRDRAAAIAGRRAAAEPPRVTPDMLYAAVDGTGLTMTAKETEDREGKGEDGRARTRELKLGVFFTQDKVDDEGRPVRDRESSSYVSTLEPVSVFTDLVKAEGIRRGADHVRQLTILGDGAAWIWAMAAATFPEATCIAGLYHAREHLASLAKSLEFILPDKDEWLAARREDLDNGRIDRIEAAVREYDLAEPQNTETGKELGYFLNNRTRMRYSWFRSRGLFVGSGVVEAGCKAVIGQRLKLSGMRWTAPGADAIAALRCQQASRPEDRIWPAHHNQTLAALPATPAKRSCSPTKLSCTRGETAGGGTRRRLLGRADRPGRHANRRGSAPIGRSSARTPLRQAHGRQSAPQRLIPASDSPGVCSPRLLANVGVVLVFIAFYLRFLKHS